MNSSNKTAKDILEELHKMPLFRLSLGSKELFHSNFLEFLWDLDVDDGHIHFIKMINELLGETHLKEDRSLVYYLSREKENFDICIYHMDGNSIIYDLILENKVKSIPYKEQLDKYSNRITKKNAKVSPKKSHLISKPSYLLLSLATDFPDMSILTPWKTVHYDTLESAIKNQSWPQNKPGSSYIDKYRDFILSLNELGGAVLNNYLAEPLFQDVKTFKDKRLHDLYIKLRCTSFMLELKSRLETLKIPVYYLVANQVRKQNNKHNDKPGVYLNVNVFNAVGQVGALVWTGKENDDIYEVIVQGDQFRHGINQATPDSVPKRPKQRDILNKMWIRLNMADPSKSFLNEIRTGSVHYPKKADEKKNKKGPYDDYDNGYVYRYIKCDKWTVRELLKNMADDIKDIAQQLGIISPGSSTD